MSNNVRWIRSYVLAEPDGTVGTVCIYQASSPEAIRDHAKKADLPADEICRSPIRCWSAQIQLHRGLNRGTVTGRPALYPCGRKRRGPRA
jgi:hypothetical protein